MTAVTRVMRKYSCRPSRFHRAVILPEHVCADPYICPAHSYTFAAAQRHFRDFDQSCPCLCSFFFRSIRFPTPAQVCALHHRATAHRSHAMLCHLPRRLQRYALVFRRNIFAPRSIHSAVLPPLRTSTPHSARGSWRTRFDNGQCFVPKLRLHLSARSNRAGVLKSTGTDCSKLVSDKEIRLYSLIRHPVARDTQSTSSNQSRAAS